jgi:hypothetical protein
MSIFCEKKSKEELIWNENAVITLVYRHWSIFWSFAAELLMYVIDLFLLSFP